MFGFLRTPVPRSPSAAISRVVELAGLPADVSHSSLLRVVESRGRYSGRKVLFIRCFDPVRAAESAVIVQRFRDLDAHPGLVLWSGHVESDGIVGSSPSLATPRSRIPERRPGCTRTAPRTPPTNGLSSRGENPQRQE
jgi:hypothetical protein